MSETRTERGRRRERGREKDARRTAGERQGFWTALDYMSCDALPPRIAHPCLSSEKGEVGVEKGNLSHMQPRTGEEKYYQILLRRVIWTEVCILVRPIIKVSCGILLHPPLFRQQISEVRNASPAEKSLSVSSDDDHLPMLCAYAHF